MRNSICVVILAGGLGTRMRSEIPKVLYPLMGKPIMKWVIDTVMSLKPKRTIVVTNPKTYKPIYESINEERIEYVVQKRPLGTANAFLTAYRYLNEKKTPILVINADTPLVRVETLKSFIAKARRKKLDLAVLSFEASDPKGYGRIIRADSGRVVGIKEETDLSAQEKSLKEVNSGIYYITARAAIVVSKIKKNPHKGEYYLTDLLELSLRKALAVDVLSLGTEDEFLGINTKEDLLKAQRTLRKRLVMELVANDVVVMDEERVYIDPTIRVGSGTVLYPDVYLEGTTTVGAGCIIYPNVRIVNSVIEDNVVVRENSVVEDSIVHTGAVIGPFARLRPGTEIMEEAKIGNFVEVKNSKVGAGTKALHLSYLGDADIGKKVNIGAGTITCNYDGLRKHKTVIEDGVFVGSDTQLVAPVKISRGAYIGAGSTITKDVPEDSLAISRTPQRNIQGWAKKKRDKR